jgi:hypothetical protein
LDHVKFVKNKVEKGALRVDRSVVSISNGVFYENNDDEAGTDLYIVDNRTLAQDGLYVTCVGKNNIFCDGVGNRDIFDSPTIVNTNCKTAGVVGKPGTGVCVSV